MHSIQNLWHPISGSKLYESSGSRTTFGKRWSQTSEHIVEPTPEEEEERKKKAADANLQSRRTAQNLLISRLENKCTKEPRR